MLEGFEREKGKIIKAYNKLVEHKFVPLREKNIKESDIQESIRELEEGRFIVSFCGQIKAGKSTLLNALLFGEEVLPTASTPHTAKITIINYAEEPCFDVIYYSEDEWKELKQLLLKEKVKGNEGRESYFDKYLKPQIIQSIHQGVFEDEVIGKPKETIKELSRLNEFVGANGKFTPFVKEIHLYYPNDILKQITIVDTPGTNDPNPYRSKITEDWIHRSNAVVYVVYAGQAFSAVDIEFIDRYLVGIDPQLLIFAVNKMDMVNESELRVWVDKVRKDERLRARRIMQDDDSVVYVSGLGGLIKKLIDSGKFEDSQYADDDEFIERLDESGWIAKPGLEALEEAIERKIIDSKGRKILDSHKAKIKGIIIDKISELKQDIRIVSKQIESCSLEKEELEKKIAHYREQGKQLETERKKLRDDRVKILVMFQNDLSEFFKHIKKKFISELENEIRDFVNIDDIKKHAKAVVSSLLFKYNNKLLHGLLADSASPINSLISELETLLRDFENRFRGEVIVTAGIKAEVYRKLSESMEQLKGKVEEEIEIASEELAELGFWEWINFLKRGEQLEKRKKELGLEAERVIDGYFKSIYEQILRKAYSQITLVSSTVYKNIENEASRILEALTEIQQLADSNESRSQEFKQRLKELQSELNRYCELSRDICSIIGVEIGEICSNN